MEQYLLLKNVCKSRCGLIIIHVGVQKKLETLRNWSLKETIMTLLYPSDLCHCRQRRCITGWIFWITLFTNQFQFHPQLDEVRSISIMLDKHDSFSARDTHTQLHTAPLRYKCLLCRELRKLCWYKWNSLPLSESRLSTQVFACSAI